MIIESVGRFADWRGSRGSRAAGETVALAAAAQIKKFHSVLLLVVGEIEHRISRLARRWEAEGWRGRADLEGGVQRVGYLILAVERLFSKLPIEKQKDRNS